MDIRRGSNPNEMWQEVDDAKPGKPALPLHPATNNQNPTSLPSASIPCLLLVSRPLDRKSSRRLSSVPPIISFPIIIPCLTLSMDSFGLLEEFPIGNPIAACTPGPQTSEVVYSLPRANLIP